MIFNIFIIKTFIIKSKSDFNNCAGWIDFVNENINYSKTSSKVNDYIGKCDISELPSFHPHWSDIINKKRHINLKMLEDKFETCKKDESLIKVYFNKTTTLSNIEDMIKKIKSEIDNYENTYY